MYLLGKRFLLHYTSSSFSPLLLSSFSEGMKGSAPRSVKQRCTFLSMLLRLSPSSIMTG